MIEYIKIDADKYQVMTDDKVLIKALGGKKAAVGSATLPQEDGNITILLYMVTESKLQVLILDFDMIRIEA